MKTVYALFCGQYSDTTLHGVYSTREAAQAQIDRAVAENLQKPEHRRSTYGSLAAEPDQAGPWIDEFELDGEAYEFWAERQREWMYRQREAERTRR